MARKRAGEAAMGARDFLVLCDKLRLKHEQHKPVAKAAARTKRGNMTAVRRIRFFANRKLPCC